MMDGLRTWLLGIAAAALAGSLANDLAGKEHGVLRLTGGLLLLLALLRPLAGGEWESIDFAVPELQQSAAMQAAAYEEIQLDTLSVIIEETAESYIWDKACELGMTCTVSVRAEKGESGIPLPASVTVTGPYDARLAAYLEEEVGIPAAKQIWLEEEIWTVKGEKDRG